MPCSHVFEFGKLLDDYVYECAKSLRLSSECPCTDAKALPAQGLLRAHALLLLPVFYDFSKNPNNYVETDHTSERFLDGNSILREVRATACVGRDVAVSSNVLAPTPPWLRCEDLRAKLDSSGVRPTPFSKAFG
jgi:hypothetical protein